MGFLAIVLVVALGAPALSSPEVIGAAGERTIAAGDSLIELARDADVGFGEMADANPGLDAFVPEPGSVVVLPTAFVVPRAAARGTIVVNLSELRLYFTPAHRALPIATFPVGIGSEGFDTPLGGYTVVEKIVSPAWYPPPSVKRDRPELPDVVPPGPENPLGTHALRLSANNVLIHGTHRPWGVGRRVSRGCIRLYPEDIVRLFPLVPVGTPVRVVREPVKVGVRDGRVWLEVHADLDAGLEAGDEAFRLLAARGLAVDPLKVVRGARERTGVPVDVTADAATPVEGRDPQAVAPPAS